uniref:Uncharacterized protein n=1 Tax=Arundo donax TaxID=35708 RepID=A0A0A9A2L3_ARUDO
MGQVGIMCLTVL